MPTKYVSQIQQAKQIVHKGSVEALNAVAKTHVEVSQDACPVDKGNLQESIRQEGEATEQNQEAVVAAGGIEINGVIVDYAEMVNDGHTTSNGGRVPGTFFMDKGIDAGIQQAQKEGHKIGAELKGIGTVRTF